MFGIKKYINEKIEERLNAYRDSHIRDLNELTLNLKNQLELKADEVISEKLNVYFHSAYQKVKQEENANIDYLFQQLREIKEKSKDAVYEEIHSEQFLDEIAERFKRKQLK